MAVERQICVGVAGEENRTEVDLQGYGLNPAVHADVPFTWRKTGGGGSERKVGNVTVIIEIVSTRCVFPEWLLLENYFLES